VAYGTVAVLTATTYIFGGLMREQVCTYMCPWPRIQAAMLDENSLTVTYNDWRGEPRGRHSKKAEAHGLVQGDCVDCNACVAVCPMGIDIRDGQQLECITCALCIDACDAVMDKLDRPRGLISYATLSDYSANMELAIDPATLKVDPARLRKPDGGFVDGIKHFNWRIIIRPRSLAYMGLWSLVGIGLLVTLMARDRLELNVQHDRNPQYVLLSNGDIQNGYTVKILNMIPEPRQVTLSLAGLEGATMSIPGFEGGERTTYAVDLRADRLRELQVHVHLPKDRMSDDDADSVEFRVVDEAGGETARYRARFNTPED